MRIAHVTDCYLPRLGGIEIQVHDLAAAQQRAGHDVQVLTRTRELPTASGRDAAAADPVPVSRFAGRFAAAASLRTTLFEGGFDAVHVHSSVVSPFAWSAARLAVDAAIPTVLTMHSMLPAGPLALSRLDARLGLSRSPVIWTAVSRVAAEPMRRILGSGAVSVLPNGIDPQPWRLTTPRPQAGSTGRELTLVSVLRLSRRKRPMALLRTLRRIRHLVPAEVPLRAMLIGEGPWRPRMERYLQLTGLDSWVQLTGRLSRPEIGRRLAMADIYLAPAQQESFGIAALEARCAGLPVIAMAGGGVGEFVRDGREGYLVGSDGEMARVTADLITSPRLWAMQEHNRTTLPEMTWSSVVDRSLALYHQAGAGLPVPELASS